MKTPTLTRRHYLSAVLIGSTILLSACSDDDNNDDDVLSGSDSDTADLAFISGVASDYSSGSISMLETDTLTLSENIVATGSDIAVKAYGDHYYLIERLGTDAITKFAVDAPTTPVWNYSVRDDSDLNAPNPYDIVFAGEDKAYVVRYSSDTAWVINPSAESEAQFKTGELDLSAYNPGDNTVEMNRGLIVGDKLFISMQRYEDADYSTIADAYVAVFDINDDSEIDTGTDDTFKGIKLPVLNPDSMVYNEDDGLIYVQGFGTWAMDYQGGIATIDPDTYSVGMLIDDDNDGTATYGGQISKMTVTDGSDGYFVSYAGWGDTSLYHFNTVTGEANAVEGFSNTDIRMITSHDGQLWVSTAAAASGTASLSIIDPADDSVLNTVSTGLNPTGIAFTDR
ncbi:hypothetical protein Q4485_16410 [Granulosicoccaceae sp. 1_MG-2023]|nr:hypothetical protein [Granulosicoccaceae sp. 1_MG-2023]